VKSTVLFLILQAAFIRVGWAVNADSLGNNPWTSYLRSDVPDTALGIQYLPAGATIGEWGAGECKIPFCTQLDAYNATGSFGQWSMNGSGLLISCQDATQQGNAGITFDVRGTGARGATFQFDGTITPNEHSALIYLTGNSVVSARGNPVEMIRIGEIPQGGQGIGSYITSANHSLKSLGYYNDVGVNGIGVLNETNNTTRPGDYGQSNVLDYVGGGRGIPMIFYDQGSGGTWPMIVFTGSGEYPDSAMIYRWGMTADSFKARNGFFGRKAEVETVKTALCGYRTFGNSGHNLCDTILVPGVAESTTVVTASYAGGFESATCTSLRIKVAADSVIVKRGAVTDPERYYWQATMMLRPGQVQGPKYMSPDSKSLGFLLFPNPTNGQVTIKYSLPRPGPVELGVYNMLGQKVKTVINQWQPAGYYSVQWDGKNEQGRKAAAGIYHYQIKASGLQQTEKIVLVK
jgi:hypothetical protein